MTTAGYPGLADPAHPASIATRTGLGRHVYSVAYSHSGRVLVAASNDGTVQLWEASPAEGHGCLHRHGPAAHHAC